jgi:hypothetical protein
MAKTKMLCPFSNKPCQECPQYRGRHYFLCFYTKYRGYLGDSSEKVKPGSWQTEPNPTFDMPLPLPKSPKWLAFDEFVERKRK